MKKRNKLIIISVVIIFIILGCIVINKKNINYISKTQVGIKDYEISLEKDFYPYETCNAYNDKYSNQNVILRDEYGNNIYVVQGCAWDVHDVLEKTYDTNYQIDDKFKKGVCDNYKEVISIKYGKDQSKVDEYNNSLCVKSLGYEKLEVISSINESEKYNESNNKETGKYTFNMFTASNCENNSNDLKGKTAVLEPEAVEGYPVYLVSGCAWALKDIIVSNDIRITEEFKKKVCDTERDFIENSKDNKAIEEFNVGECVTNNIVDELDFIKKTCDVSSPISSGDYDVSKFTYGDSKICSTTDNPLFGKTVVLKSSAVNERYPVYLVDGCAWSLEDIVVSDNPCIENEFKKQVCETAYDFISENYTNDVVAVNNFNLSCIDTGILDLSKKIVVAGVPNTVKFSFVGGSNTSGEICNNINVDYNKEIDKYSVENHSNSCLYKFNLNSKEVTIKSYDLPNTDNFVHQLNGTKFIGWKLAGDSCDNVLGKIKVVNGIDANGNDVYEYNNEDINLKFTYYPQEIVLEPCFENNSNANDYLVSRIYQNCDGESVGIEKSGTDEKELKYSKIDVRNIATLNSNIKTDYLYKSDSSTTENIGKDMKFSINKYCSIKCTETVTYKYPTIFETVKSGTYFELLSYPEVTSIFTCTQNNNYDQWLKDYKEAIKKEAHAYITYKNIQNIENMMSANPSCNQITPDECCSGEGEEKTCDSKWVCTGTFRGWGLANGGHGSEFSWIGMSADNEKEGYSSCGGSKEDALKSLNINARNDLEEDRNNWWKEDDDYYFETSEDMKVIYEGRQSYRKSLEKSNKACANAMVEDSDKLSNGGTSNKDGASYGFNVIDSDSFYKNDVYSRFYYETSDEDNISYFDGFDLGYSYEELDIIGGTVNDTGVHDWNVNTYKHDDADRIRIYYLLDIENEKVGDGNFINTTSETNLGVNNYVWSGLSSKHNLKYFEEYFTPTKTAPSFQRSIVRTLVFGPNPDNVYYSKFHSGNVSNEKNGIKLGYVYPVPLTFSGSRNVYFTLKYDSNLGYGAETILTDDYLDGNNNKYKCSYDVTNDIIVEDNTTVKEDDYKKNFYIRSISTTDVDPNNRFDSGTLGMNWANERGQALKKVIETKSKNNNTYNPNNLEYSFTLNAGTIEAIRGYNNTVGKYDNFDVTTYDCNDIGGECRSEFLTNLADGMVNSTKVNDVNAKLGRDSWKYYIDGKWIMTDKLNSTTSSWKNVLDNSIIAKKCIDKDSAKNTYECIYRNINEGVLP